jgi:hypothetical protein
MARFRGTVKPGNGRSGGIYLGLKQPSGRFRADFTAKNMEISLLDRSLRKTMKRTAKRLLSSLIASSALLISSVSIGASEPAVPTVLFQYTTTSDGHHTVEPLAILEDRRVVALPEFNDEGTLLDFIERVYPLHKGLAVIQGGRPLGTATVAGDVDTSGCAYFSTIAEVTPGSPAVAGVETALAINSGKIAALNFKQRPPTDTELANLQNAARATYLSHKTGKALIDKMKPFHLTAYDSADNKEHFIAGSFIAEDPNPDSVVEPATLFLVLAQRGSESKITYQRFHEGGEANYEMQYLVDLFDIDGDGVPELVTRTDYYESSDIAIYQQHGEKWDEFLRGAPSGC